MSRIFLAILISSSIPFHVASLFLTSPKSDNLSTVYSLVEKWSRSSNVKLLTIVFDNYQQESYIFNVPDILNTMNVSTKLVTLKHLIYLKYKNMDGDYELFDPGSCILILFYNIDHLREIFNSPHLISFWQADNFYILYDNSHRFVDWFELERFFEWGFEKLWRFRRIYKVILFINEKTIRYNLIDFAGYQTKRFLNSSCDWYCVKNNHDSFLIINEPNDTDVSDFFEWREDFKSYPMKISIFRTSTMSLSQGRYSGVNFKYLEEITKKLNVTTILMKSVEKYGWKENGVFVGTIGHLVYQLADVTFNEFFIKDYLTRQVEFTTVITSDMLCALVPKAAPIPDHLVIVKIFSEEAWFLIFAGYFVIFVITMALKDEENRETLDNIYKYEQQCFCELFAKVTGIFGYFVKQNNTRKNEEMRGEEQRIYQLEEQRNDQWKTKRNDSKRTSRNFWSHLLSVIKYFVQMYLQSIQPFKSKRPWFPERLVLMCSMLMSIILNGVFTSQLAFTMSKQMYYKEIDTLEELEKSGLPILSNARDVLDDVLKDDSSPLLKRLHQRLQYANDSEAHRKLFLTKDAAVLHRLSTVSLKYAKNEESKNVHVVNECPKHYILGFMMTKGSPFRHRINSILGRLNNAGFYGKWYRDMFQSERKLFQEKETTEHRKITIRHLLIPFVILHFGLATSTIVFICELWQNNLQ
ncbi:uncharacterized protein LOC117610089 [Osmia lignaria lignaria]|uniref:uncharacterized protein LOC117610089 n=1 Tax=Osmia lignaria lignaria TaxID=1437193 RepID=UPI00402BB04D